MTIPEMFLSVFAGKEGSKYGRHEIVDRILSKFPGTNKNSVLPADYCYNITNKGNNFKFPYPLFKYENKIYEYLGPNYPYNGKFTWKGEEIGYWKDGEWKHTKSVEEQ